MNALEKIVSFDNAKIKKISHYLKKQKRDSSSLGVWIEGDHLMAAAYQAGWKLRWIIWNETVQESERERWQKDYPWLADQSIEHYGVSLALMKKISSLSMPAKMGAWIEPPCEKAAFQGLSTRPQGVVLDRLQDPGNVGTILRSAAAMGFFHIWAMKETVSLWSPKVLRSAMGAHFSLQLIENATLEDLKGLYLIGTSAHQGQALHEMTFDSLADRPFAWVIGHEGQGMAPHLSQQVNQWAKIHQSGGQESLNAAVAASICMYASQKNMKNR